MGHWGWRPLVVTAFISVWVAGCNLISDSASSTLLPSTYPEITLTAGSAADRASPTGPPLRVTLAAITPLQPSRQITLATGDPAISRFATSTPVPLQVAPPHCEASPGHGTICLGRVENDLPVPVERVVMQVQLLRPAGESPMIETIAIEQNMIPPGEFAPYRALFEADWNSFMGATSALASADLALLDSPYVSLPVEDLRVELDGLRVRVSGVIVNPGPDDADLLRAVVTLVNPSGVVAAYRVISLNSERLPAGGSANLEAELLLPEASADALPRATMHVEARAG